MHIKSTKYGDIPGWKPDRLCRSIADAADRAYSYVLVTTKAIPDVIRTSDLLRPLLTVPYCEKYSQPTYVLLQNGLNVEVDLYQAVQALAQGAPSVIGTALHILTNLLDDDVVEHADYGWVSLGVFREDCTIMVNTPAEDNLLGAFADLIERGGGLPKIVPEIQRVKFAKNLWNVTFSSVATLVRYPLPSIYRAPPNAEEGQEYEVYASNRTGDKIHEYTIANIRAVMEEVVAVARAMGIPDSEAGIPSSLIEFTMQDTLETHAKATSTHRPSMLLDAENGRPIEVEAIVGEVVRMAKTRGVAVPRTEMLYALLLVVQNQTLRKLESRS
ncbi:6-phosphogluconate dehydrogenase C-terminal domain-like protein [Athelia psychrophila]|uniref:6-phosphogluconate dehydrogenase C-terminal domain-like protein n=1 Tax=Athelia psychrophila TaxID=1759441 RepID=A0A166KSQ3_9AGAM|nr:6-phosphogluconate dehydrogenase C-terminal domain-like protein [Fibularhizoctonia sp. CBS 109695]